MSARLLLSFVILSVTNASASDKAVPPLTLFALPKVELKSTPGTNAPTATGPIVEGTPTERADPASEGFSLTKESASIVSEASIQSIESMNGLSVLHAPERPTELGGAVGWLNENVWDPVFAPEVIKVGKVKMTGGVIAAVKRKNPFCLLHPLVFAAGW